MVLPLWLTTYNGTHNILHAGSNESEVIDHGFPEIWDGQKAAMMFGS
jgi:hypothetical protein